MYVCVSPSLCVCVCVRVCVRMFVRMCVHMCVCHAVMLSCCCRVSIVLPAEIDGDEAAMLSSIAETAVEDERRAREQVCM